VLDVLVLGALIYEHRAAAKLDLAGINKAFFQRNAFCEPGLRTRGCSGCLYVALKLTLRVCLRACFEIQEVKHSRTQVLKNAAMRTFGMRLLVLLSA
jgi:hypothetical protein